MNFIQIKSTVISRTRFVLRKLFRLIQTINIFRTIRMLCYEIDQLNMSQAMLREQVSYLLNLQPRDNDPNKRDNSNDNGNKDCNFPN